MAEIGPIKLEIDTEQFRESIRQIVADEIAAIAPQLAKAINEMALHSVAREQSRRLR